MKKVQRVRSIFSTTKLLNYSIDALFFSNKPVVALNFQLFFDARTNVLDMQGSLRGFKFRYYYIIHIYLYTGKVILLSIYIYIYIYSRSRITKVVCNTGRRVAGEGSASPVCPGFRERVSIIRN